jgi:amino acid transporter
MYAVSGNIGAALSFIVLAAILAVFAVGYAAMSRHVANAGAFYAYIANGLGRASGVAGSAIALAAYNAIQIGLYGLIGAILNDFMAAKFDLNFAWWIWAIVAWVVVGLLGILRTDLRPSWRLLGWVRGRLIFDAISLW